MFVFLLGASLDVFTTIHIIQHPSFIEGNPLVRTFINSAGASGIYLLKFGVYLASVGGLIALGSYSKKRLLLMTYTFGSVWLIASMWNAYLFFL